MTSTTNSIGMDPDSRSSSRVLNPPGGKGSINLFGGGDPTPQQSHVRSNPKNSTSKENFFDQPGTKPSTPQRAAQPRNDPIRPQQPEPKPSQKMNNPVAQQGKAQQAPPVTGGRPSTKVHAPPGGASTFTFG